MSVVYLRTDEDVPTLAEAACRFLRRDAFEPSTKKAYERTLTVLTNYFGDLALYEVTGDELQAFLDHYWAQAAATTFNRHRAALLSFYGWAVSRGWLPSSPAGLTEPRKVRRRTEDERRERPISQDLLADLWKIDGVTARDRLLWRMAYETWARADELLGLNIEDLDVPLRECLVVGKGGDRECIYWSTGTARLLPRVLGDRTSGPVFLASRLPGKPMPTADLDPMSGRARLSYRQAARLFAEVGQRLDPGGPPWTLHRLRHAGISHAVEAGWDVTQIRAKSRHASLRSLEVYANPSGASVAAMTAALDQESRRRR